MAETDMVESGEKLRALYRRPGFLIRRAHQIAVSIFLEETAALGITTTQYGTLVALSTYANLDQVGLAKLVGIDRSTTALVVSKLEAAGLVVRQNDPDDRRRRVIVLTDDGRHALDRVAEPAQRAQERALAAFAPKQAQLFLDLLAQFVDRFNEETRAPIVNHGPDPESGHGTRSRRTPVPLRSHPFKPG